MIVANEPIISGMAGRYAIALFELARDERSLDAVKTDLDRFDALVEGSDDMKRLVRSPVFSAEEQAKALSAILDKANIRGITAKFLGIVAQKRRLFAIRDMIKAFGALVARHKGETRAEVTVAEPLSDAHLNALRDALKANTKKDIALDVRVDPSILGGLKVKLGSRMIDSSLKTKLNSIKFAMKEAQ
jgi:F-type H+-transporting ATPase subunit delta